MRRVKTQAVAHDQVDLMLPLVDTLNVMDRPQKPLVATLAVGSAPSYMAATGLFAFRR
jgi:hypothetical protein